MFPVTGDREFWPDERFVDDLKLKTEGLGGKDDPAALFHAAPGRFHLGQRDGFDGNFQLSGGGHFKKRGNGGKDAFERKRRQSRCQEG